MSTVRLSDLVAATPDHRNRAVDLLRAVAISAVVLGHWLAVVLTTDDGRLSGTNLLAVVSWTHPLTWLFQVMPVFFLVGGYANAASWTSHRRRDGDAASWLLSRVLRLLWPTAALLGVLVTGAVVARAAGADPALVADAVWLSLIPAWFLVVYLVVVLVAPLAVRAHRRWGVRALLGLALAVVLADVTRFAGPEPRLALANHVLVWLLIHQAGVAWWAGTLPEGPRRTGAGLVAGGLAAAVLLTALGPYPVSMVGVPGEPVSNTSPPSVALLAFAAAQCGAVLLAAPRLDRWLRRSVAWTPVVVVNARIMTIYLWHMAVVVPAALLAAALGGTDGPAAGSGEWLAWRVPWVLLLAVLLGAVAVPAGRAERPPAIPRRLGRWRVVPVVGGALTCAVGLLLTATGGRDPTDPLGTPTAGVLSAVAGLVVCGVSSSVRPQPLRPQLDGLHHPEDREQGDEHHLQPEHE
ncbi:MAG: acyltransferase family protein [Dermatophilaceae bacterium]